MMWELQGGMGECVIAPVYEALLAAGVEFRFFHKVASIDPVPGQNAIASVQIDRQADMVAGEYKPTFAMNGLNFWPIEPDWAQLKDGQGLKARGVNFESHWCAEPPVERVTLVRGQDFDDVVLAIPLGGVQADEPDPGMCDALIARGGRFADFVHNLAIVPTMSAQLWTNVDDAGLGWTLPKPATVAGPQPLCVWADMSQVAGRSSSAPGRRQTARAALSLRDLSDKAVRRAGRRGGYAREGSCRSPRDHRPVAAAGCRVELAAGLERARLPMGHALRAGRRHAGEAPRRAISATPTSTPRNAPSVPTSARRNIASARRTRVLTGFISPARARCRASTRPPSKRRSCREWRRRRRIANLQINIVGYDFPTRKPSDFLR